MDEWMNKWTNEYEKRIWMKSKKKNQNVHTYPAREKWSFVWFFHKIVQMHGFAAPLHLRGKSLNLRQRVEVNLQLTHLVAPSFVAFLIFDFSHTQYAIWSIPLQSSAIRVGFDILDNLLFDSDDAFFLESAAHRNAYPIFHQHFWRFVPKLSTTKNQKFRFKISIVMKFIKGNS